MRFIDLGRINYKAALERQLAFVKTFHDGAQSQGTVLFCEHDPCVYTGGKRMSTFEASAEAERLRQLGAECHNSSRGGLTTWHGLGQLTVYPIMNISQMGMRNFVFNLESIILQVGQHFNVPCERMPEIGVATIKQDNNEDRKKFGFIGVAQSHGIAYHGLAVNVSNDLTWFKHIVPCGLQDLIVTSLEKETGGRVEMGAVKEIVKACFIDVFKNTPKQGNIQ